MAEKPKTSEKVPLSKNPPFDPIRDSLKTQIDSELSALLPEWGVETSEEFQKIKASEILKKIEVSEISKKGRDLLRRTFLKEVSPGVFKVDFRGNENAQRYIGAGHLFGSDVICVEIFDSRKNKKGKGVRGIGGPRGVGYFNEETKQYIPIFTGDTVQVVPNEEFRKSFQNKTLPQEFSQRADVNFSYSLAIEPAGEKNKQVWQKQREEEEAKAIKNYRKTLEERERGEVVNEFIFEKWKQAKDEGIPADFAGLIHFMGRYITELEEGTDELENTETQEGVSDYIESARTQIHSFEEAFGKLSEEQAIRVFSKLKTGLEQGYIPFSFLTKETVEALRDGKEVAQLNMEKVLTLLPLSPEQKGMARKVYETAQSTIGLFRLRDAYMVPLPFPGIGKVSLKEIFSKLEAQGKMAELLAQVMTIAIMESSLDPQARPIDPHTGKYASPAKGLFQFLDGTWDNTVEIYSSLLGIGKNVSILENTDLQIQLATLEMARFYYQYEHFDYVSLAWFQGAGVAGKYARSSSDAGTDGHMDSLGTSGGEYVKKARDMRGEMAA